MKEPTLQEDKPPASLTESINKPGTKLLRWLKVHTGHVVTLSILVGIVAGLGAVAFSLLLDEVNKVVLVHGADYVMPSPGSEGGAAIAHPPGRRWFLLLAPAIGGLLSGLLIYSLAPEAEGHGTDAVINSFHRNRGIIRGRVPFIKTIASVLTIGTGGSAGREGPIAQIGAGFGSSLAGWLKTSDRDRRILVLAGAGAGIGAIFRAPLGGALFAVEVLYRDAEFESAALVPAFVAAIIGYSVYSGITGVWGPIFDVPSLQFVHPLELPFYAILGLASVVVGSIYVKVFYATRDLFRKIRIPNHVKPAIGGLLLGLMGLFIPEVLGMGYGWVQLAINGHLAMRVAILLLVTKMFATALTIGSGGSGGVFAPSMVIGGLLGWASGTFFHHLAPTVIAQPAAFVLVGMAGFFAGVAKVPVSSLVMVSEMTTGYGLLVPSMLTNAIAFLLTPRSISMYENQVNSRVDSGAHAGEYFFDVLDRILVAECVKTDVKVLVFHRDTALADVLDIVSDSQQPVFPVLNADTSLYGVIDLDDIRFIMGAATMASGLVIAQDLCLEKFQTITPDESLAVALRKVRNTQLEALPVVKSEDSLTVIGILSRRDISNAYHDYLYRGEKS
ncbi:MAG TPA: chloride channel protein [Tepidisphaeraceae bacterium]|nr:chloride channel protein [Tepidisphaeraceae bacterium]